MNALNATYDVNWGVPDGAGLKCSKNASFLPICMYLSLSLSLTNSNNNNNNNNKNHPGTNTSSPFYDGSWTMYDNITKHDGLRTATKSSNFGILDTKNGKWSLEIAFPIRNGSNHGGLLDSEDGLISLDRFYDFTKFDPSIYDLSERSMYWSADFARTVRGVPTLIMYLHIKRTLNSHSNTGTPSKIFDRCRKLYVVSSE